MARYEVGLDSPVIYFLGRELVRPGDSAPDEVELTDEQLAEYRQAERAFWGWQNRLSHPDVKVPHGRG